MRSDIEAGLLEIVLPDWTLPLQLELSLLYRRRATMDSKVRVFIEFLMQILRARTSVTAVGVETGTQKRRDLRPRLLHSMRGDYAAATLSLPLMSSAAVTTLLLFSGALYEALEEVLPASGA